MVWQYLIYKPDRRAGHTIIARDCSMKWLLVHLVVSVMVVMATVTVVTSTLTIN